MYVQLRLCSRQHFSKLTRQFQVQGDVLVLYVYQLRKDANGNENVGVEKVSFRKNGGEA